MAAKLISHYKIGRTPFEEPDEDEDGHDEEDGEYCHKFQPLIDEINKQTCGVQLPCGEQPTQPEGISEENILEEFNHKIDTLNDGNDRSCADCTRAMRVLDMNSLQRGQHISMPGEYSSHYFKSLGKRLSAYRHHAIVKEIVQKSHQTAEVILIHFYKEEKVIKVCEETRNLDLLNDELYIIKYQHPRYDPDTIVQRAENISKESDNEKLFTSYNPFTKNCEHFATWCVVGEEKSLQANSFINQIKQMLWDVLGGGSKIAQLLLKLLVDSSDEIATCVTRAVHIPSVVLGISFAAHIIYCVIKTAYLIKQYRNEKTICWQCLKQKLLDLWLQFGVFGVTSLITFVIINFALPLLSPGVAIPIAVMLVLVGTALTLAVPRIRKALWSPVEYSKKEIKTFSEIKVGDVVSLTYYGFTHLVVVSEVHMDPNPEKGEIQGIHYSLPTLFGARIIAEETFQIDLENFKVNRVDFKITCTYSPQEVVDRAKKRIGERKWNISSNRSEHLCLWAKEILDYNSDEIKDLEDKETNSTQSGKLSSLLVGKADIHLMNEIEPGDVVEHKSYKGIIVKLEDMKDGREFRMHLVIRKSCFNYFAKKLELRIDLNKDCLTVYRYHPVHCVSKSVRVEKAIGMVGQRIKRWTQTGFIIDIILKQS